MTKHEYICKIAEVVASKSTCLKHQVGATFVSDDYEILATGYNGAQKGAEHCKPETCTEPDHCLNTIHAEQNAIVQAAKRGISLNNSSLYCTYSPCVVCARMLVNLGVQRVDVKKMSSHREGADILREAGILMTFWDR